MSSSITHEGDIAVVGAGIVGLSIARELAAKGASVVLVGNDPKESGTASSAAGAMLGAIGEVTESDLDCDGSIELTFRVAAARRWPEFVDELGVGTATRADHVQGSGTFMIANLVNEADRRNLAAAERAARAHHVPVESVDPVDVTGLEPARGHEAVAALFLPTEGWVNSWAVLDLLAAGLAADATWVREKVDAIDDTSDGFVLSFSGRDARVRTRQVVLAAGAGCQRLIERMGFESEVPVLLPKKGVSLEVQAPGIRVKHVIRTPNRNFACGSHIVPRGDHHLYIGATNRLADTPGAVDGATVGEIHGLLHSAIHEINVRLRRARVMATRVGLRPLSVDHRPLIGKTSKPGVFIATGTYRNGVLMAPLIADILAEEITSGRVSDRNPFSLDAPSRRGASEARTDDAIREGAQHLTSFLLEPGGRLPYDRERELHRFVSALLRDSTIDAGDLGKRLRELADGRPIAEVVPQFFYEVIEHANH